MHDYLRAIGFSSIQTKTEFENILKDIEQNPQMDFITDDGVKPVSELQTIQISGCL